MAERRATGLLRIAGPILAIALPLALWDRHGAALGVLAFAVYSPVFLGHALAPDRAMAWSRRHVALDAALVVPLAFCSLAGLTDVALWLCALFALAFGAVVIPLAIRRRGSPPARSPSR